MKVFKISIQDLAKELNIREDSLKLTLRRMEKEGMVVLEGAITENERRTMHKKGQRNKGRKQREAKARREGFRPMEKEKITHVRYTGYKKQGSGSSADDIMYV